MDKRSIERLSAEELLELLAELEGLRERVALRLTEIMTDDLLSIEASWPKLTDGVRLA